MKAGLFCAPEFMSFHSYNREKDMKLKEYVTVVSR